jgi:site-specific recombinase XerD
MNDKPISDLRRRMLEDMAVRRLGEKTRHDYIKHIETFTRFLGRSPDTATAEDLRRFQVHELEQGGRPSKMNTQVSALRFFFGKTLGTPISRIKTPASITRAPRVLPMDDVTDCRGGTRWPRDKAAFSIAYGADCVAARVMLRVSDIDSKRMLVRSSKARAVGPARHSLAATVADPARPGGCRSLAGLVVSRL